MNFYVNSFTGYYNLIKILNYLLCLATCLYLKYIKPSNINQIGVKKIAFLVVSFTNNKQNTKKKNTNIA